MRPDNIAMEECTKEQNEIIQAALFVAEQLGTTKISLSNMRDIAGISEFRIRREFENLTQLCAAAGLDRPGSIVTATDEELLDEVERVFQSAGKKINQNRFEKLSKYGLKVYRNRFGNWSNVISLINNRNGCINTTKNSADEYRSPDFSALKTKPKTTNEVLSVTSSSANVFCLTVVDATFEYIKSDPFAYRAKIIELYELINAQPHSKEKTSPHLNQIIDWLKSKNKISNEEFRTYLLAKDMLPSAVVDEVNNISIELLGDLTIEEEDGGFSINAECLSKIAAINLR